MITDKLKNAEKHYKLNKRFAKAFDFVKNHQSKTSGTLLSQNRIVVFEHARNTTKNVKHTGISERIKKARRLDKGSYKIQGRKIFANVIYADKKPKSKLKLEAHKKYVDIHFTISGKDLIGWKDIKNCKNKAAEYNAKDDYMLFSDRPDLWINVPKGHFAIFFPEDAHAPMRGKGKIKKIVVKVSV